MIVELLRHGRTEYNAQHRYQGRIDAPLSEEGKALLFRSPEADSVRKVYVSDLKRTQQTAAILFPEAEQIILHDLREADFGDFEGRTAAEMVNDAAYRKWVDEGCLTRCPNGESSRDVIARASAVLERLIDENLAAGEDRITIVAHGGIQMAIMSSYVKSEKGYWDWAGSNGGGFRFEIDRSSGRTEFRNITEVSYSRG